MNSSTTLTFANTTQVDCTKYHTCSDCLAHWACVWCPNVVDVNSPPTTNATSTSFSSSSTHHNNNLQFALDTNAHCAHFSNPLSKSAPLCPQWQYRVCGVAGWITLSVGAALLLLFLVALGCLCWCCWCRGRCGASSRHRRRRLLHNSSYLDSNASSSSSYAGVTVTSGPMSSERRRLLSTHDQSSTSQSPTFHSTPTPITDKRRRDMATKWGVGSLPSSVNQHLQTAAYSSEPSNAPPVDSVYFSSIN
jgi:hypothetical protein